MKKKPKKPIAWCVTVGKGGIAYVMGNKVFDKKRDAIAFRKSEGYPELSWSDQWFITKLQVMK